MTQSRRDFLATLGGAALTMACGGNTSSSGAAAPVGQRKLSKVGIQLYTMRSVAQRDLRGTLEQLAKIGYTEMEFAGYHNHAPAAVRDMLKANGLTAPSTHVGINVIEQTPAKVFDDSRIVGHQWLTVPSLPPGPRATVDDWKRIAAQFNRAGAVVKEAGFRFAFHNHADELRKVGDQVPLEIFLKETDPTLVSYEMDLYWVVNGGGDPIDLFARYPNRFKMVHVKDSMGAPDHRMADVGAGKIDFKSIFAKAAGIEHYFVEHDQPADAIASATASYRYLASLAF